MMVALSNVCEYGLILKHVPGVAQSSHNRGECFLFVCVELETHKLWLNTLQLAERVLFL